MARHRILRSAVSDETRRVILREAEDRYRNENMDWDERERVIDRIIRLRRELGLSRI